MTRQAQAWVIRNKAGQYIATYRAYTGKEAINRLMRDNARTASIFRRSQPVAIKADDFIASVEVSK
jgi:hypothetical protein